MKPIFINNNPYKVQVPTPSGAGKIIPPGYAVEGGYFLSSWKKGAQLTKLSKEDAEKFDRGLLLISLDSNDPSVPVESKDPAPELEKFSVPVFVEPKEERKDLGTILQEAMGQMRTVLPSYNELRKMSFEELKEFASPYHITGYNSRQELLKMIRERFLND